jgi:hypothetical protein
MAPAIPATSVGWRFIPTCAQWTDHENYQNSTKLKSEVSDFLVETLPSFSRNTSEQITVPHSRLNPVHIQLSVQKCDITPKRQRYPLPFNRSHTNATTHHFHYKTLPGSRQWCCGAVRRCFSRSPCPRWPSSSPPWWARPPQRRTSFSAQTESW